MKLVLLPALFMVVSCATTIPLSTGNFKTYADADYIWVTDGAVAVTMRGMNHSRANESWAAAIKSLGGDTLKTVRHAMTMSGIVDVANSLTGLAKDKLATDAAMQQAEISASTKAAELKAANDALKITTAQ